MIRDINEAPEDFILAGKVCGRCFAPAEKVMKFGLISCPDKDPTCCVAHYGYTCFDCRGREIIGDSDKTK